jgi:hypothetical protein
VEHLYASFWAVDDLWRDSPRWRIARVAVTGINIGGGDETGINARLEISHGGLKFLNYGPLPASEKDRLNSGVIEAPQHGDETGCEVIYNGVSEQPSISHSRAPGA